MSFESENISTKNISFEKTGDPFVDTGSLVLQCLVNQFPEKTLLEIIDFSCKVYINAWNRKLHSIFHTNSKVITPKFTKTKNRDMANQYFMRLIAEDKIDECISGNCRTCGKDGRIYLNSRDYLPLSGSGALVNFHHSHEKGIYLCNECSIKLFFVPLGVLQLGGKIGMLHVQSDLSKQNIYKFIIQKNLEKIAKNTTVGILKSKYSNPKNALFNFTTEIIQEVQNDTFVEYFQLFHFSNFGATPYCDIYMLPNPVFTFLNKVVRYASKAWYAFVQRHYFIKGAEWNSDKDVWVRFSKQEANVLKEEDYLNNKNLVFERLLANKSILPQLLRIYRDHYIKNYEKFPLMIAIHYAKEVLNMSNEQLLLIQKITNTVFELSRKENNYKKYVTMLEGAGKAYQLRSALLRIIKANYKNGEKEPLIRLEEYVNYLFPDGQYWGEVRDLLLIHLYEKFHDEGVNTDEIPEEIILETEDDEPNHNF